MFLETNLHSPGCQKGSRAPKTNWVNNQVAGHLSVGNFVPLRPDRIALKLEKASPGPPAKFLFTAIATLLLTKAPGKCGVPVCCYCCSIETSGMLLSVKRKCRRTWASDVQNHISFASSISSHLHTRVNEVRSNRLSHPAGLRCFSSKLGRNFYPRFTQIGLISEDKMNRHVACIKIIGNH